jgi:general secretion pathway protein E
MGGIQQQLVSKPETPVGLGPVPIKLGQCLVDAGKLSTGNIDHACRLQQEQDQWEPIGSILVKLGLVAERDIAEALSSQLGLPLVTRQNFPDEFPIDEQISPRFLKESRALIIDEGADSLTVVMADPRDSYVREALSLFTGKSVIPRIGIAPEIDQAITQHYETQDESSLSGANLDTIRFLDDVEQLKELASEAPVVRLVNQMLHQAVDAGASDVHIEPFDGVLKIRYRIDGLLREYEAPPASTAAAVISRIKIMASLDIAERRLAQDGRFKMRVRGKAIDLRVSTVPTIFGESVVLRLLNREDVSQDFGSLGFSQDLEQTMRDLLTRPHGILLVTGPTGSGKSTTLYAALMQLNTPERKILTVEDPVEYNIEGVNQIQVKPQIGLTFASALRSIVRQDPDIIMVGEMRDGETATIAVQSALTGHLVLSTLHTNDAAGSISRLLDMGVEDYLLTSTVNGILAQRLVRTLCSHCREAYTPVNELLLRWGLTRFTGDRPVRLYRAVGCEHCGHTGYNGRTAILEMLVMSEPVKQLVLKRSDAGELARVAAESGMQCMFDDGMRKVVAGETTIEEVCRVTQAKMHARALPVQIATASMAGEPAGENTGQAVADSGETATPAPGNAAKDTIALENTDSPLTDLLRRTWRQLPSLARRGIQQSVSMLRWLLHQLISRYRRTRQWLSDQTAVRRDR